MEIAVRAFPVFGRPRGFSILLATLASKSSGSASAAGRALEKVALVHSGFSTAILLVLTLRFIVFRLTATSFPQADYVDSSRTWRKYQGMQPSGNQAERLISAFSVVSAEIFNYKAASHSNSSARSNEIPRSAIFRSFFAGSKLMDTL
jgi:hypothetical protein